MLREQTQVILELDGDTLNKYGMSLNEANFKILATLSKEGLHQISPNFYTVSKHVLSIVDVVVCIQTFSKNNEWFKPSLKILNINQTLESSDLLSYL